jgi:hypothetical protein
MSDRDAYVVHVTEVAVPNQYECSVKRLIVEELWDFSEIETEESKNVPLGPSKIMTEAEAGSPNGLDTNEDGRPILSENESLLLKNFSFFGGRITQKPAISYFNDIAVDDQVIVFAPINRKDNIYVQPKSEGRRLVLPEKYIFPLPKGVPLREAVLAASSSLFIVNALFEKAKLKDSETVLIINGGAHNHAYLAWQIAAKLMKGKVLIVCGDSEEYNFLRRVGETFDGMIILQTEEVISLIREETGGIGADLIIDLGLQHDSEAKRIALSCLAPSGR